MKLQNVFNKKSKNYKILLNFIPNNQKTSMYQYSIFTKHINNVSNYYNNNSMNKKHHMQKKYPLKKMNFKNY